MKHYPILAWPGGKRRMAKVLLPLIESRPHTCYVEAFSGAASMLMMRRPAEVEVLNDVNNELAHLRLTRVWIETLDWSHCISKWDRDYTLFLLDPPYWQTEGYGVPFPLDEYYKLAETMRAIKGSAILTINDHPDMRQIFKGFKMQTVDINYTIGGGGKGKGRQELIYTTW